MKQQIISVLAASLFLAGSMVTSSVQAWGPGCYKAYEGKQKSCTSESRKQGRKAKTPEEFDKVEKDLIKCRDKTVKTLLECRLDKGKFIENDTDKEEVQAQIWRLGKEITLCEDKCAEDADLRKSHEKAPDSDESRKIWEQCQEACGTFEDKKVEIMKKYISTLKEPSQKK